MLSMSFDLITSRLLNECSYESYQVPARIELASQDSESYVLTITD